MWVLVAAGTVFGSFLTFSRSVVSIEHGDERFDASSEEVGPEESLEAGLGVLDNGEDVLSVVGNVRVRSCSSITYHFMLKGY